MSHLDVKTDCLGFELHDGERLVTLYRATEEADRYESPKPGFHPIYTPNGKLITEYRPRDHLWHYGLYYGWVHVNEANLWGGGWYIPESGKYEDVPGTYGRQAHESFDEMIADEDGVKVIETVTWRDAEDSVMASEERRFVFTKLPEDAGTFWRVTSVISPVVEKLTMGSSKASHYSGFELRMGPPFADAAHRNSEGAQGHEATMGSQAKWCCAVGACGGAIVMLDHPSNPRHPTRWFTRRNLMGAALLWDDTITTRKGESLTLQYGFMVLAGDPADSFIEEQYQVFASE